MSLASDAVFREQRWRRAGATDKQIEQLRETHAQLPFADRAAEGQRVDGVSDADLATELAAGDEDPTAGNADDVIERVGDDAALAAVVLSHESTKTRPRKRVVEAMTALIERAGDGDG